jgi:hypothetical protein
VATSTAKRPGAFSTTRITGMVWPMPRFCQRSSRTSPAEIASGFRWNMFAPSARLTLPK